MTALHLPPSSSLRDSSYSYFFFMINTEVVCFAVTLDNDRLECQADMSGQKQLPSESIQDDFEDISQL